jgi:hypothetical protein
MWCFVGGASCSAYLIFVPLRTFGTFEGKKNADFAAFEGPDSYISEQKKMSRSLDLARQEKRKKQKGPADNRTGPF